MEPYEFMHTDSIFPEPYLAYRCYRGSCNGHATHVLDRNTHNNYHNHVDNGLPSPYADPFDFDF